MPQKPIDSRPVRLIGYKRPQAPPRVAPAAGRRLRVPAAYRAYRFLLSIGLWNKCVISGRIHGHKFTRCKTKNRTGHLTAPCGFAPKQRFS